MSQLQTGKSHQNVPSVDATSKLERVLKDIKFDTLLLGFPSEREQLRGLINECLDAFASDDNDIGLVTLVEHAIVTGDNPPVRARARQYSHANKEAIADEVRKYKETGVVRPSSSPWASPVLIVKKKDGSNRMVVDYSGLNLVTVKDSFPLPNIRELIDRLSGARWFTALDVLWGYHNIKIAEDSVPKTAFIANDELLEFTRVAVRALQRSCYVPADDDDRINRTRAYQRDVSRRRSHFR